MFKALFALLLVFIFLQDFKSRGVYWFLFPVLAGFSVFFAWKSIGVYLCYNILFLILMMLMLTLYVSLKESKLVNITRGYFSWGDILFLLAITPLFSLQSYILFFTAGTILSLLIHLVAIMIRKQDTIPYAGYMSLVLIPCLLLVNQFPAQFNIYL